MLRDNNLQTANKRHEGEKKRHNWFPQLSDFHSRKQQNVPFKSWTDTPTVLTYNPWNVYLSTSFNLSRLLLSFSLSWLCHHHSLLVPHPLLPQGIMKFCLHSFCPPPHFFLCLGTSCNTPVISLSAVIGSSALFPSFFSSFFSQRSLPVYGCSGDTHYVFHTHTLELIRPPESLRAPGSGMSVQACVSVCSCLCFSSSSDDKHRNKATVISVC